MIRPARCLAFVLLVTPAVAGTTAAGAQPAPGPEAETAVEITSGPTSPPTHYVGACSDVAEYLEEATSFVLERAGDPASELAVSYREAGSAVSGQHYAPLTGEVTFEPGASAATIEVDVIAGDSKDLVELQIELVDGPGYQPGTDHVATIQFVSPRDESLGPVECGFWFAERGIERFIEHGQKPERLVVIESITFTSREVPARSYEVDMIAGALPGGLTLGTDGRFGGAATDLGTYSSVVRACRTVPPYTCTTAPLTITVVALEELPRTGFGLLGLTAGAAALLVTGGLALVASTVDSPRRTPRPRTAQPG